MICKEKAIVRSVAPVQSGTSARGFNWSRTSVLLDIPFGLDSFKQLNVEVGTDLIGDATALRPGQHVEVGFTVSSHEWQGRWFTKAEMVFVTPEAEEEKPTRSPAPVGASDVVIDSEDDPSKDLPF